jgi:hypothetical protein
MVLGEQLPVPLGDDVDGVIDHPDGGLAAFWTPLADGMSEVG